MKNYLFICLSICFLCEINAQSTASTQVSKFEIEAPQLNTHKTIWVYLPKSYESSSNHYPVFYMHDGQNLFDKETSYVGEWKIDEYLDSISDNEVIVIGIEHGGEKRIDELTPYPNEKYGGGNGDAYLDFIIETVKPHVDITYRTLTESENTTIFGSSLGGLISLYGVIKYPKSFGNAGVFSPAFWINPEIYNILATTDINKSSKFFFLVGTEEGGSTVSDQVKLVRILKEKGIHESNIVNKIIEGGQHNEGFWSTYFEEAHNWLLKQ